MRDGDHGPAGPNTGGHGAGAGAPGLNPSRIATVGLTLEDTLLVAMPADVDYATLRLVDERSERLVVRRGELEPVSSGYDTGVMITVWHEGGLGYAATSDLSESGLRRAGERARHWAESTATAAVRVEPPRSAARAEWSSPVVRSWDEMGLRDRIDMLQTQAERLRIDDRMVDWIAALGRREVDSLLLTTAGGRIRQQFSFVYPALSVTAADGSDPQTRTFGGHALCGQGGIEVLDRHGFGDAAPRLAEEALELVYADNCPSESMDVLLAPDQTILQIHESIGHPLELDRILGDERNYAGTSFVTADMFGSFRYGSELLNVTFDPTVSGQLASYGFDDEGTEASRQHLIRDGVLERPLGGAVSQARAGLDGVANARACSWNRPPIDRMANLNIEPGDSTFDELLGRVEHGIYMRTNSSWSIDDSRNKFQFSCEHAQLIENGELTTVVRNPSYRGISSTFWRNLVGVADRDSFTVMGTPNCGKGELNQQIGTGHASPACLFADVEVFGAES